MAKNPLFSTYRQGENRVTSSMLAVFERIDLSLLERLLAQATGESTLQMVTFVNQPSGEGGSVPDGRISGHFAFWFEVKTALGALREGQLRQHLACLGGTGGDERLFVVTPDLAEPALIRLVGDGRVKWFSFTALSDAIDGALGDPRGIVSEQNRFLLRELQALLEIDGLLHVENVVVVAARDAYPEYRERAAYVCQSGRAFRAGLTHMGFYSLGKIQVEVPEIRYHEDGVIFSRSEAARRRKAQGSPDKQQIGRLIDLLLDDGSRHAGEAYQVFLLSALDDDATVKLPRAIENDTRTESGRPWAWTLGQRYVGLSRLSAPGVAVTSQLE